MQLAQFVLQLSFWLAVGLIVYTYVGYPLLIGVAVRLLGTRNSQRSIRHRPSSMPSISILISAYNAEDAIGPRIQNLLECDYPASRLEIVVASDGSTDATAQRVRSVQDRRVRLLDFSERRGKAATLAASIPRLYGQIVVFTDATTRFDRAAIRRLAEQFSDPDVGIACGRVQMLDAHEGRNVDSLYWKFELCLKRCEARLNALVGASGAIYAMRRRLFIAPQRPVANDDFTLPLLSRLQHGCRMVWAEDAQASVSTPPGMTAEFRRRCRIGAGGFQSLAVLWRLLDPRHGWLALAFLSHKLLRWCCPLFLIVAAISNAGLCGAAVYAWLGTVQCCFYLLALGGGIIPGRNSLMRVLRMTTMFSAMNLAFAVGFWRWLANDQLATWEPTPRQA